MKVNVRVTSRTNYQALVEASTVEEAVHQAKFAAAFDGDLESQEAEFEVVPEPKLVVKRKPKLILPKAKPPMKRFGKAQVRKTYCE